MGQIAILALAGVFAGLLVSFPIFLPSVHISMAIDSNLRRWFTICAAVVACGLVLNNGSLVAQDLRMAADDCTTSLGYVACASAQNEVSLRAEIWLHTLLPPSTPHLCITGNQTVCHAITSHIAANVSVYSQGWESYIQGIMAGLLAGLASGWMVWTITCSLTQSTQQRILATSAHTP